MSIPIALQIYSVREDAEKDLFGVLKEVSRMGYQGVEFAGLYGNDPKEIKKVLDDLGLVAEGTHTGIDALSDENISKTIDDHLTLDCKFVVVPWIPESMRNSKVACEATGAKMAEIGEKLRPHGLRTGFHAHGGDMELLPEGKSPWFYLAASTPEDFIMQYDTANGVQGGADPVQPILDLPGRGASVHLKEWKGGHGAIIGEGEVPWQRVFDACETVGGTQWYVVEHETDSGMTPLQAVDKCLQNLRAMGK